MEDKNEKQTVNITYNSTERQLPLIFLYFIFFCALFEIMINMYTRYLVFFRMNRYSLQVLLSAT